MLVLAIVLLMTVFATASFAAPATAHRQQQSRSEASASVEQQRLLFSPSDVIGTVLQLQANDARREASFFCRFLPNCHVAIQQKVTSS